MLTSGCLFPQLCLSFLDAVICYSAFPPSAIQTCVVTLCHTLNIERFIQRSLEVGVASYSLFQSYDSSLASR